MIHWELHYGDVFETPETAERSNWYGITSHPHVRFDGMDPVIGATNCLVAANNYRSRINDRLAVTGGVSPIEITGTYEMGAGEISVDAACRLVDPVTLYTLRATILIYENNVYWCCGAFGVDTWQRVTRVIHDQPITLINQDDVAPVVATIPLDPSWNPSELHVMLYVQDTESWEIFQGYTVPSAPTAVTDIKGIFPMARIEAVTPNPSRGETAISFRISPESAAGPVRLDVFDLEGRRIACLVDGLLPAGPHVAVWDGRTAGGALLPGGSYFARISSGDGSRSARFVLVR